jgi:hypothetical protein
MLTARPQPRAARLSNKNIATALAHYFAKPQA